LVRALLLVGCLASLSADDVGAVQLLVGSNTSDSVYRYDASGAFVDVFASGGGLSGDQGLVFGPDGNLYVSSRDTGEVLRFDGTTGAFIDVFATTTGLDPNGLSFGPDGRLYVANGVNDNVARFDGSSGSYLGIFTSGGGADFVNGIAFGPDGDLFATSQTNEVIRFDGTTGASEGVFATGLSNPTHLAFGPDANLYVVSNLHDSVRRYDGTTGAFIDSFVVPGSGGLDSPVYLRFVPEPSVGALLSSGVLCVLALRRRRTRGA
jgi:streptogramin lyase